MPPLTAACLACLIGLMSLRSCMGAKRIDVASRLAEMDQAGGRLKRHVWPTYMSGQVAFGLRGGEDLKFETQIPTSKGTIQTKFQEIYQGLPIIGETVVIERYRNGRITGHISGSLVEGLAQDLPSVKPRLTVSEALRIAVANEKDSPKNVLFNGNTDATLKIYLTENLGTRKDSGKTVYPRLVFELSYRYEQRHKISRPFYIIDAMNGEILDYWQSLETKVPLGDKENGFFQKIMETKKIPHSVKREGGNLKTGRHLMWLNITREGPRCFLENEAIRVIDLRNVGDFSPNREKSYNETFKFDCSKGFNDSINGAYSPMSDLLFYGTKIHEMFKTWFNVPPLGAKIAARAHYSKDFENAFWDGKFVNFGDGLRRMYPLVSLDMVAHETAHGFTEQNSRLIQRGQSGAIAEAFSDITGEAAENFVSKHDWLFGYDIMKQNVSKRYFVKPALDGRSISHASQYCSGMDPHFAAGVFNHAFYVLSNTKGWSVKQAYLAFVTANRLYWKPNSDFVSASCDIKRAAKDLGYPVEDVNKAFLSVGIEPCKLSSILKDDIKAFKNDVISLSWNISSRTKRLKVGVRNGQGVFSGIYITRHGKKVVADTKSTNKSEVTFETPTDGNYHFQILAKKDILENSLYAEQSSFGFLGDLAADENLSSEDYGNYSFVLPKDAKSLRLLTKGKGYFSIYIRKGKPVDTYRGQFDMVKISNGRQTGLSVCNAQPTRYYVLVIPLTPVRHLYVSYTFLTKVVFKGKTFRH